VDSGAVRRRGMHKKTRVDPRAFFIASPGTQRARHHQNA
jgi:hypothetical protein